MEKLFAPLSRARRPAILRYAPSAFLLLALLISCSRPPETNRQFEALASEFLEELMRLQPERATSLGDHRYDHLLDDYSAAGRTRQMEFLQKYAQRLATIDAAQLSRANSIDYQILKNTIEYGLFELQEVRSHEWNPLVYGVGGAIYDLLAREFAPLPARLQNVKARLEGVPAVVAAARANLTKNPPRVHTETAISQNKGNIALIRDELNGFLDQAPELKPQFAASQRDAIAALEDYQRWLEKELLPRSNGDFRLGAERFRRKLAFALQSDLTAEQILARAEKDLNDTQAAMFETAAPLYRRYFPTRPAPQPQRRAEVIKAVLDKLAESRPDNASIVTQAQRDLEETTRFVKDKNLVTTPAEPVRVITMPEFKRGVSVAYCDSPGPLEKGGETFYAISPTPADWKPERVTSFFREYNDYMLKNLTVHEAMPGHYLQLAHSNRFEAPTKIRSVFYSGPFVEGWATYAELLMVENGFGGPEVKMQQLKMRLRLIINAIIDQKIHAGAMTEKEAIDLMMKQGFQEEGEAVGKWRRACLSSAQLSTYYVGNLGILSIREAWEAKHGAIKDWRAFHDKMLSFGSPPPKYLMQLLELTN